MQNTECYWILLPHRLTWSCDFFFHSIDTICLLTGFTEPGRTLLEHGVNQPGTRLDSIFWSSIENFGLRLSQCWPTVFLVIGACSLPDFGISPRRMNVGGSCTSNILEGLRRIALLLLWVKVSHDTLGSWIFLCWETFYYWLNLIPWSVQGLFAFMIQFW